VPGDKESLRAILDESDDQSFAVDRDWRYLAFNRAHAEAMRESYGADIAVGDDRLEHLCDEDDARAAREARQRALTGERFVTEDLASPHSHPRWLEQRHVPILGEDGEVALVVVHVRDVTAQRHAEIRAKRRSQALERLNRELIRETARLAEANAAIAQQARTDDLTGIANRRQFLEAVDREVSLVRRQGGEVALLALDLDGLKVVNDTEGHAGGDEALIALATLLAGLCRTEDLPARVGGDEFGILLPGVGGDAAKGLAERTVAAVRGSIQLRRRRVTVSIGVAAWRPGETARSLLRRADDALYACKRAGGDRCSEPDAEAPEDDQQRLWRAPARRRGGVV
jgi:diguanylate cyclase (GGDEF)-like protein/PAS domain S-box-containing protein